MTSPIALPCPVCFQAVVTVQAHAGPAGRGVYADDPVRCSADCALAPRHIEQILRAAYRQQGAQVCQLTLPLVAPGRPENRGETGGRHVHVVEAGQ